MTLTDAFCDPGSETKGGLGGVLLTGTGSAISFFSVPVADKACNLLAKKDEATVIYELEMLAVLIGFLVFKEFLMANIEADGETIAGIGVVSYIDNDAARYALIAGTAKKDWLEPLSEIWRSLRQSMGSYLGSVGSRPNPISPMNRRDLLPSVSRSWGSPISQGWQSR